MNLKIKCRFLYKLQRLYFSIERKPRRKVIGILINIDEAIINYSEEKIYESFISPYYENKNEEIIYDDCDFFINFLKENMMFSEIICSRHYNNGRLLLFKLLNIFKFDNIDILKLYKYIKKNVAYKMTRETNWQTNEISITRI
jgi:hypothetical protein